MSIDLSKEGLCGICARMDLGIGRLTGGRLIWVCDDPDCLEIAMRAGGIKQNAFNKIEAEAAIQGGGNAMGQFLDEAGFGHLFEGMPPEVWAEACKVGIAGYRRMLKKLVDDHAAPF